MGRDWATLRESQLRTLDVLVPNTAMAVITDVGDPDDIHPSGKAAGRRPVGARARALAYGEQIEYSGPIYEGMAVTGDKVVLRFKHAGGGLLAKDGELTGFTIAGEDKVDLRKPRSTGRRSSYRALTRHIRSLSATVGSITRSSISGASSIFRRVPSD